MDFIGVLTFGIIICAVGILLRSRYRAARPAVLVFGIYLIPLILNVSLPYTYGYPFSPSVGFLAVFLAAIIVAAAVVGYKPNRNGLIAIRLSKWPIIIAYVAVACFLFEYLVNPAIRSESSMERRREYLEGATFVYTLGTVLSGAALYCLLAGVFSVSLKRFLIYACPWLLYALCSLAIGNRQFFFLGVLAIVLGTVFRWNTVRRALRICTVPLLATVILLFAVQYARGSSTEGRQDTFFMSLFNISFTRSSWLEQSYTANTIGTTLYAYYGTQYHFLTYVVREQISDDTPLSNTFPLVYRRIDGYLGLPYADEVRLNRIAENRAQLGFFPRSWGTQFTSFHYEYGIKSLLLYSLLFASIAYSITRLASNRGAGHLAVVAVLVSIGFGINFFIFVENASYLFIIMAITQFGSKVDDVGDNFIRRDSRVKSLRQPTE